MTKLRETPNIVIGILMVGLLIAIGIIYMLQLGETAIQMADCVAVTNESYTANNGSTTSLAFDMVCSGSVVVFNASDYGHVYSSGNYTFNLDRGTILWTGEDNGTAMGINYTHYDKTREEYQSLNSTATALTNFTRDWFPIIILAVAVGIVIMLLMRGFFVRRSM